MLKGPSNTMQCFKRGDGGEVDENWQVEDFLMDQDYSKKYPKRNTTNDRKVSKVS